MRKKNKRTNILVFRDLPLKYAPAANIGMLVLALVSGISIIGILFVIAGYVWWAALLILLFCIPLFVLSIKSGKKNYQAKRDTSQYINVILFPLILAKIV